MGRPNQYSARSRLLRGSILKPVTSAQCSRAMERRGQVDEGEVVPRLALPADQEGAESFVPAAGTFDHPRRPASHATARGRWIDPGGTIQSTVIKSSFDENDWTFGVQAYDVAAGDGTFVLAGEFGGAFGDPIPVRGWVQAYRP